MKRLLILAILVVVNITYADTINYGRVTDKAIDLPRKVHYPYVGPKDINKRNIYWLEIDYKWHRVTSDEYSKAKGGQFFSRKTNVDFYPEF